MKFVFIGARILAGLIFLIFGLNGFFQFIPQPPMPEAAGAFMGGLAGAAYMFPLIKGLEVVCGILFLTNRFAALAAVLIAPISINILLFHIFLAPAGTPIALAIIITNVIIAFENWSKYGPLLRAN